MSNILPTSKRSGKHPTYSYLSLSAFTPAHSFYPPFPTPVPRYVKAVKWLATNDADQHFIYNASRELNYIRRRGGGGGE